MELCEVKIIRSTQDSPLIVNNLKIHLQLLTLNEHFDDELSLTYIQIEELVVI